MDDCDNPTILHDKLPKVNNHIVYCNPDSGNREKAFVISQAGKTIG